MKLFAFNAGCNIIGYKKNEVLFGMTCAWAQMIDFDKVTVLLGEQSVTGKNIEVGMLVGISALAEGQESIASKFGDSHSNEINKYLHVDYQNDGDALLIAGAKVNMVCKVIDILRPSYINNDYFIVLSVLKYQQDEEKNFLGADKII